MAMAFAQQGSGRVALSFIGEGGSSLGEWHEAINLCAARKAPAIFCVQNNQTALSTPVADQSAVRVFADKAQGYGIPGITIDGTDPDEIAAAFTWAVERAREGRGPALIELVCMRMCGHAHHDDMLYLGKDPQAVVELSAADRAGLRQSASSTPTGAPAIPSSPTRRASSPRASSRPATPNASARRPKRWSKRKRRPSSTPPGPRPRPRERVCSPASRARTRVEVLEPSFRSAHRLQSRPAVARAQPAARPERAARSSTR